MTHGYSAEIQLRLTLSDPWVFGGDSHAIHLVRENIKVEESDEVKTMVMLATNAYRRTDDGWRMILHHASPAPADSNVVPVGRMH